MKSYFFMKEKRWNGTDSEKTDLICKLTVDNILFLSEKRLPNVSNKKNAKYEEFIEKHPEFEIYCKWKPQNFVEFGKWKNYK